MYVQMGHDDKMVGSIEVGLDCGVMVCSSGDEMVSRCYGGDDWVK